MYTRVYDPYGEVWEILTETASRLILNDGWTQSPVVDITHLNDFSVGEQLTEKTPKK